MLVSRKSGTPAAVQANYDKSYFKYGHLQIYKISNDHDVFISVIVISALRLIRTLWFQPAQIGSDAAVVFDEGG